jgi:hypothetical protein
MSSPQGKGYYYPPNRKKKIPHEQYCAYERVLKKWRKSVEMFTMLRYNKEWWACREGTQWGMRHVEFEGKTYTAMAQLKGFKGHEGDRGAGWVYVVTVNHKRPQLYGVGFLEERYCAAKQIQPLLGKHFTKRKKGWYRGGRPVHEKGWVYRCVDKLKT